MTLTVEINPKIESRLREEALQGNVSLEQMAARWLYFAALSPEEREELEDEADLAAYHRAKAQNEGEEGHTLDELREALGHLVK